MVITSNIPLLRTQEYFNKISLETSSVKNRKAVFKFVEALYDLNLWYSSVFWFLTLDKNSGTNKLFSLGGLAYLTANGNNLSWTNEGIEFNGTSSYIDTNFKPSLLDNNTNNVAQGNICTFCDVVTVGQNATLGAVASTISTRDSKFALDISSTKPVSYSCYWEDETKTTEVSGSSGFWLASTKSTINTSETFIHKNGLLQATTNFSGTDFVVNKNVFVGCYNNINNQPDNFTQQKLAFVGFSRQMDQSLAQELYKVYKSITQDSFTFLPPHSAFPPEPEPSQTPAVTPTITPSTSGPNVTPSGSLPAVTPSSSNSSPAVTPTITPSTSGPNVTPSNSSPVVTPSNSSPAITPSNSLPVVTPSSSSSNSNSSPSVTPSMTPSTNWSSDFPNKFSLEKQLEFAESFPSNADDLNIDFQFPDYNCTIFLPQKANTTPDTTQQRIFKNNQQIGYITYSKGYNGRKFGLTLNLNSTTPEYVKILPSSDRTDIILDA